MKTQLSAASLNLLLSIDEDINVAVRKLAAKQPHHKLEHLIEDYTASYNKLESALLLINNPTDDKQTTNKYKNRIDHSNKRYTISQKEVRNLLYYNPQTGNLHWKNSQTFGRRKEGDIAGTTSKAGYINITINSKTYTAHRLIWLYVYGYFPEYQIDHINRKRDDNRLCNLREVTQKCNVKNSNLSSLNKTGVKGVSWKANRKFWLCSIRVNDDKVIQKLSRDFVEAVCYRLAFEQCLNWNLCDSESTAYKYLVENGVIHPPTTNNQLP